MAVTETLGVEIVVEGMQKFLGDMKKADGLHVAVGFPKGKARAYPDGEEVAFVAACHVYGYGVPTRDFMALAKKDIIKDTKVFLERVSSGKGSKPELYMEQAGKKAVEAIQKAITDLKDPPNTERTIQLKGGSSNPLIDTEHMRGSVDYEVRTK